LAPAGGRAGSHSKSIGGKLLVFKLIHPTLDLTLATDATFDHQGVSQFASISTEQRTHLRPKYAASFTSRAAVIRRGGGLMRQREWVASTFGDCPVREEVIGLLYRSSEHHVQEFISGLSPQHRASLAAFCYGRAHLHEIGLTIAATCEFEELVAVAGSAGHFLFWQSRELSSERKPVALSKQMNVTLASRAPAQ
jgi:hypothetical protein